MRKKPAFKATERIDRQVRLLLNGNEVKLWAPGRRVKWRLRAGRSWLDDLLQVHYRFRFCPFWIPLNPGFHLSEWESETTRLETMARIVLGQIAVGKRYSGRRLWMLHCGRTLTDGWKPHWNSKRVI